MPAIAATRPINPPGAEPVLTEAQVWEGLCIKARQPMSFVKGISSCEVVLDTPTKVTRMVRLGNRPTTCTQDIEIHEPSVVYFELETGNRITNILSYGPSNELLLTYTFSQSPPGTSADLSSQGNADLVGKGIEHGIERMRQLVREGIVKAA